VICLVQLPIPEIHDLYNQGNILLAAGYLAAYAKSRGMLAGEEIRILSHHEANYGGDMALVERILHERPRLVGFTTYMWNIERSLYIAARLKEKDPTLKIILGGPEITDYTAPPPMVDSIVIGEGEGVFLQVLHDLDQELSLKPIYQADTPLELGSLANPYLEGILKPWDRGSMFIETMRGCPYPCKYCFYSKSYKKLRYFPRRQLEQLFALARQERVTELYIMDPSFNVAPGLIQRLEYLKKLNTSGIPMHTEIRLEDVTPEVARLMKAAGFHSVEAGLQTVNQKALKAISRQWNREKFIQGARLLMAQGIDVKTGVIMGLPYDTPADFEETLDFIISLGLEDSMELYPLSLIPGTRLRDEAGSLGLAYMMHPPYWVLSSPWMAEKDFKLAVEMVESKLEIEFFPPIVPCFENHHPPFVHFLDLRRQWQSCFQECYSYPQRLGHSLTILFDDRLPLEELMAFLRWLGENQPFTLLQLVLVWPVIPAQSILERIREAFFKYPRYFDRIHYYKMDMQGTYSLRFFHLTADLDIAERYIYESLPCDLVFAYPGGYLEQAVEILENRPLLWVEETISAEEKRDIQEMYQGFEGLVYFKK